MRASLRRGDLFCDRQPTFAQTNLTRDLRIARFDLVPELHRHCGAARSNFWPRRRREMASVSSGRRANIGRASLRVDVHIYYLKKGSNSRKKLRVRGSVDVDVLMATRIDRGRASGETRGPIVAQQEKERRGGRERRQPPSLRMHTLK